MFSSLALLATLLSTLAIAQPNNFNIDTAEETKVINDIENYITTLEANPTFQTDIAAILSAIPTSLISAAEASPDALLQDLEAASSLPTFISAIPISVLSSLETLAAKPIAAVEDITQYIESLTLDPDVLSVLSVLESAVPTPVQDALENDPISFLENLVTATVLPSWVADIPAPIQSDIGSVINEGLSIVAPDLETSTLTAKSTPTAIIASGRIPGTIVSARPTGTIGASGYNGTKATGSLIPYKGAAAPVRWNVALGMTALVAAGAGFWILA